MEKTRRLEKQGAYKKKTISYAESQKCNKLCKYGTKEELNVTFCRPGPVIMDEMSHRTKVVFTNGCFDIIHPGHIEILKFAKSKGDKLIVGLNSDASVRKNKPGRPINNQEDRKAVLEAIKYVDEVILFDEVSPLELIKKLRPDVLVKGEDYTMDKICGHDIVLEVYRCPLTGHSTTKIIEKIRGSK